MFMNALVIQSLCLAFCKCINLLKNDIESLPLVDFIIPSLHWLSRGALVRVMNHRCRLHSRGEQVDGVKSLLILKGPQEV